jgi:hypothetical protein
MSCLAGSPLQRLDLCDFFQVQRFGIDHESLFRFRRCVGFNRFPRCNGWCGKLNDIVSSWQFPDSRHCTNDHQNGPPKIFLTITSSKQVSPTVDSMIPNSNCHGMVFSHTTYRCVRFWHTLFYNIVDCKFGFTLEDDDDSRNGDCPMALSSHIQTTVAYASVHNAQNERLL